MESLEISLVHKAFVSQSKAILLFFLALLLLMLAFLHMETLMPTIWHACTGFFEPGPVFAFLLLNCLIVTIIASTMLESHIEKGGHEEAIKRESMREGDEKLGLFIAENVIRRGIIAGQSHNSSIYGYNTNEGKDFAGSSCSISLNANYKDQIIKQESFNVSEKKPSYRVQYCTRRDEIGLLPNYYKPVSDSKEKKFMRGSFSFNDDKAAGLEKSQKTNGRHAENINFIDHQSGQGKEPAAAAAMTLEEAWAAIMSAKKNDDRMVANYMQPAVQCIPVSVKYENDNQAAAARTPPAAATNTPRPPAAAAANPLRSAQADVPIKPPTGGPSTDAPAAAIEKQELDSDDHEHDSELEELNRRAEAFIARFNNQMRLQRQESLQRSTGRHRRPTCNHHHIQYSNHLQLPPPGLLVG